MKKITEKTLLARVNRLNGKMAMMEAKSDPAVLKIQQDLIAQGYPLKPDGIMGPKTKAAMDWQAQSAARTATLNTPTAQPAAQPAAPVKPNEQDVDPDYSDWKEEPYSTKYLDPNEPGLDSSDPNVKTWNFGAMADENPELLKKYQIASFRKNNPDAPLPADLGGPGMPSETPEYSGPVAQPQTPAAQPSGSVTPISPDEFPDFGSMFDSEYNNDKVAKAHGMTGMRDPKYVAAVKAEYENPGSGRQYPGEPEALSIASGSRAGHHESISYKDKDNLARIVELAKIK
jgi:hypothetical protein